MKRIVAALAAGLVVVLAILLARTLSMGSRQIAVDPAPPIALDADAAATRLAGALQFQTVSYQDAAQFDGQQFLALREYLAAQFPRVHQALQLEVVNDYSLLYTWKGTGNEAPILLLGHIDVVPVDPATAGAWTHPPFGGVIADGYVWGRGAIDDKGSVLGILEAVELLLAAGYQPPRTVIIAFGHDEEILGERGAKAMSALLAERGVAPALVLDEGGAILVDVFPGVAAPVASIGIAEKGYVSIELTVDGVGGHSSVPPTRTAVGQLSTAVDRLQKNLVPANLDAAIGRTFDYLGSEMSLPMRMVIANMWLFQPLVEWQMAQEPRTNAAIRTTTAPTMFHAGVKENQLPTTARAVVNFRILPGDTVETVVEHVRRTIDDPAVNVTVLGLADNPSPVSDVDGPAFAYLARTVEATNPDVVVAPFLVLGATDARQYVRLAPKSVFRFAATRTHPDDIPRFHGLNERIGVDNYAGLIRFYAELLRNLGEFQSK